MTVKMHETPNSLDAVSSSHLVAMVGGRRQISMWELNHFRLVAFVVRQLVKDRRRLILEVPIKYSSGKGWSRLTQLATQAGWLPPADAPSRPSESTESLCLELLPAKALPRVETDDGAKDGGWRVALRLTSSARTGRGMHEGAEEEDVVDGLELVVALICANAFARWH